MSGSGQVVMYFQKISSYALSSTNTEVKRQGYISSGKWIGCIAKVIISLMLRRNGNWMRVGVGRNGSHALQHLILSPVGNRLGFLQMITKGFWRKSNDGLGSRSKADCVTRLAQESGGEGGGGNGPGNWPHGAG